MKYLKSFLLIAFIAIMHGCSNENFSPIDHHQSFVASMNILQPSLTFYNSKGDEIAKWNFNKAYTGAMLLEHDRVLLYGHQLAEADVFELSSGKIIKTIETEIGTTNAYFDEEKQVFFITNSKNNTVTKYDIKGRKVESLKLGNYPMSMASYNGKLYVINYKDTVLSVVNIDDFNVESEWEIEKSSNGIMIIPEENTLWIGGHGEGSKPNKTIDMYQLSTGELLGKINTSLMPVDFTRYEDTIYSVNHGSNELCAFSLKGEPLWKSEVGANPFSINSFAGNIIVAGFDDYKLYFINHNNIEKSLETDRGPFQLLVREAK